MKTQGFDVRSSEIHVPCLRIRLIALKSLPASD